MGGALAIGLLPLLWLAYRQSPADVRQWPDGRAPNDDDLSEDEISMSAGSQHGVSGYANSLSLDGAIRTRAYWILLAATGAWALIGTGLVFHMQAVFTSRGLDGALAAWAPTTMAIGMATMQIAGGILADRIAVRWLVVASMAGIAAGCSIIALADGLSLLVGYGVYGLAQGVMTIVAGTAWARYFGRAHLGKIRGTAVTSAVASSSAGPLIMGVSSDYLGGFEPSMWIFVAGAAALAVAGFWATPPALPNRAATATKP
jgi:MFS family permease